MSTITIAPINTEQTFPLPIVWAAWFQKVVKSIKKAELIQVSFQGVLNADLVDQVLLIANQDYEVTAVRVIHLTLGTDSSDVTVTVTRDKDTDAPGAGTDLLQSAISLKATINTVQEGKLTATLTDRKLCSGDRLSVRFAGVLISVSGVNITVVLRAI
jgi:hypothetical protein